MDEALARLAARAGVEPYYWDGLGTRRDLADDTACALLRSLGCDPATDHQASERRFEEAEWRRALPPVIVAVEGAAVEFDAFLPQGLAAGDLHWEVVAESGETTAGWIAIATGERERREIDGVGLVRCHLRLDLPPAAGPGYHRLRLPPAGAETSLVVTPRRCYLPGSQAAGQRFWGIAVQLYALRSERNWGIGDFTDLAHLARSAGAAGASLIGLNPLHARHLVRPDDASPYAPSSRRMIDPVYLDVEAIAEFATCPEAQAAVADDGFQARLAELRSAPLVDYAGVTAHKLAILELLHRRLREADDDSGHARRAGLAEFVRRGGVALLRFASFQALQLHRQSQGDPITGWREWPGEWRDPQSAAVAAFGAEAATTIEFLCYLQWQAQAQLDACAGAARAAGMRVGLYRDLAVGAADDSAECWSEPELIAPFASVGAPPDLLNREGQDWGLPPWNPRTLAQAAYRPFAELLAANMHGAGALRIDHVMALTRLFWIPAGMRGADGAYVRYDFAALAGIVALESVRNACMVVGEDLGSVPDGFREALAERGFLSYRVLIFERHWNGDGSFKRPWEYPEQALATVATHDMPTVADFWQGGDIARRDRLGMFPSPQARDDEVARRDADRGRLLALLAELGLTPDAAELADPDRAGTAMAAALHLAVARSNAMLAVVQLEDIEGEILPANIPGTHREYPNWRRKLQRNLDDIIAGPRFDTLAADMRHAGRA